MFNHMKGVEPLIFQLICTDDSYNTFSFDLYERSGLDYLSE